MPITGVEYTRRQFVEALFKYRSENNAIVGVDDKSEIRCEAVNCLLKALDGKLANLQNGEYLSIVIDIDIMRTNGKVRGGSGSQRNMPEYIEWRKLVYKRDQYTCVACGATGKLNAHHIKSWVGHPDLRFDVDNGITLCNECHKKKHPHLNF